MSLWCIPLWYIANKTNLSLSLVYFSREFTSVLFLFGIIHFGIINSCWVFLFVYSSWVYSSDSGRYIPLGYSPLGIHFGTFQIPLATFGKQNRPSCSRRDPSGFLCTPKTDCNLLSQPRYPLPRYWSYISTNIASAREVDARPP